MADKTQYFLAIRKRKNKDRFFEDQEYEFTELEIDCGDRWWLADPFLFEKDGVTYVFYEAYDLYLHRGKIGYSILNGIKATKPQIILNCPYHLSFPYIFEKNGEIYMMPETNEIEAIRLFRAKKFPNEWVEDKVLVRGKSICDTILLKNNDDLYLLANEMPDVVPAGTNNACWVKDVFYKLQAGKCNFDRVVKEGDEGVRNAGKIFSYNGIKIRPGQNCMENKYGQGMIFYKINSFESYSEAELCRIDYLDIKKHLLSDKKNINGVHTYNSTDDVEIIDVAYEGSVSQMASILFFLYRHTMIFKVINKLRKYWIKSGLCGN